MKVIPVREFEIQRTKPANRDAPLLGRAALPSSHGRGTDLVECVDQLGEQGHEFVPLNGWRSSVSLSMPRSAHRQLLSNSRAHLHDFGAERRRLMGKEIAVSAFLQDELRKRKL